MINEVRKSRITAYHAFNTNTDSCFASLGRLGCTHSDNRGLEGIELGDIGIAKSREGDSSRRGNGECRHLRGLEKEVGNREKRDKSEVYISFRTAETRVGREASYNQQNLKRETRSTNNGKQGTQRVHTFLN